MNNLLKRIAAAMDEGEATLPEDLAKEVRDRTDLIRTTDNGQILLRVEPARGPYWYGELPPPPEGVTVLSKSETDEEGEYWEWEEWEIHTLGEPIYLNGIPETLVLSFGGKTWEISKNSKLRDSEMNLLDGSFLTFTPSTKPPTESNTNPPRPGWRLLGAQVYGQPHFAQGTVFPIHEGKAAFLLWSAETPYGDCGQENMFIALDDQNRPCKVWLEWSCS